VSPRQISRSDMTNFRFFKMAAATILDFQNVEILGVGMSRGSDCSTEPNFESISQMVAEIWRYFDFSKMAAVRHLGFVMSVFGSPTKGIWWSLSL